IRSLDLPLSEERVACARGLIAALMRVTLGFERVLGDARQGAIRTQRRLNETASARALRLLVEQYLIGCQVGQEAPPELWAVAYRLYALSRIEADATQPPGSPAETALFVYKRLLAMSSLEPHSLSASELDWAAEYLSRISGQVHVQEERPPALDGAWYWLDPASGAEPQACIRRDPPTNAKLLYFSTAALARRAAEALARHEGGRGSPDLEPSEVFPGVQPVSLLGRLHNRWSAPARREQPRRRQQYGVEACIGLSAIWNLLRGKRSESLELISQWDVQNESPGGFAIMHVEGLRGGIAAGMAIALRNTPADSWSLCIVRWLRSDSPNQIELGLQIVSKGAIPVQVGFRNADRPVSMVNALVLPVLPALRHHQAVLAPSGTYTSRRFALVSDIDRLYIAQGRLLSLDMQTSNIELFQFEIDPYPT
ncbi:MAG TPA: hypothetical protein VFW00_13520, partial [Rhodocyclaceae bacterium]|nr:hypothetical protein [Rhodocyclaceae bacterium]